MNELRRMAYLDAMGIDSYVSRSQLPGAGPTRRLAIVRSLSPAHSTAPSLGVEAPVAPRPEAPQMPRIDSGSDKNRTAAASKPAVAPAPLAPNAVPRFSLTSIICGGWLWLEDLGGRPLAREQVLLVQGMARALARIVEPLAAAQAQPLIAQFDWPMHNNLQLDQGEEAARAGVAGFVGRKLEQHNCSGLVLLGQECKARVPLDTFAQAPVGSTASSAAMLADPALKKQAWADLLALAARL